MKRTVIAVLILGSLAAATTGVKSFYKVTHISQSIIGISCPGNNGDPTVVTNLAGTLLVSCGTAK